MKRIPLGAAMQAGRKFLIGAAVIVAAVGYLIVEGVRQTGV